MALRLIIEHAPNPQPDPERLLEDGELTIGRGADCDWRIEDPEMFVSRKHCVVAMREGRFIVTDASRGGLFIDGSDRALGAGYSAALENGMRLRMGDVVIRVEIAGSAAVVAATPRVGSGFVADDFFTPQPGPAPAPRPDTLPEPFDSGRPTPATPADRDRSASPVTFDDPFTLDPVATPGGQPQPKAPTGSGGFSTDDFLAGWQSAQPAAERTVNPEAARARERPQAAPETTPSSLQWPDPGPARPQPDPAPVGTPAPPPGPALSAQASDDQVLFAAFCRGLGIDPSTLGPDAASEAGMEAAGRRFRRLAEGLVQLLRQRAQEKQSVRVAQTVIGASEVNPLKFLASSDEVVAALIAGRGRGYLPPDEAIAEAFRDLTDHQLRTWQGLQSALRAMIDRFDPARFEAEVEETSALRSLLSGSRGARLWQLYCERYREIARSAEDRFLGEVGADFRDSYEGARRKGHDDR